MCMSGRSPVAVCAGRCGSRSPSRSFNAGYCHCTRCQRRTGTAASPQARIPPGALRVTSGQELVTAYAPGDGGFEKLFCSACGSALFSRHPERHELMSVRLGALDEDPGLQMEWRQYVAYAAAVGADPRRRRAALPAGTAASDRPPLTAATRRRHLRHGRGHGPHRRRRPDWSQTPLPPPPRVRDRAVTRVTAAVTRDSHGCADRARSGLRAPLRGALQGRCRVRDRP